MYISPTHILVAFFKYWPYFITMVKKLPKDIIKAIANAEFFERWNGKEWEKVPVDPTNPNVQKLKEMMMAEVEINVTKEALELGVLIRADRDLD